MPVWCSNLADECIVISEVVFMERRYIKIPGLVLLLAFIFASAAGLYLFIRGQARPTAADPVYQGDEAVKAVALTVNVDWGEEHVPAMLEAFAKYKAKATFFITGRWAEGHPDLVRLIAAGGHEIGNHGYAHPHPDHLSAAGNLRDIVQAEDAIYQACGLKTRLYAPPYGERGKTVLEAAEQAGYNVILWSVDTVDWKTRHAAAIRQRVTERLHNGAIVLMHPTGPTVEALRDGILPFLESKGLRAVTVSALLDGAG